MFALPLSEAPPSAQCISPPSLLSMPTALFGCFLHRCRWVEAAADCQGGRQSSLAMGQDHKPAGFIPSRTLSSLLLEPGKLALDFF